MDPADAARLWIDAWERGWIAHDADMVAARYSAAFEFRSHPFRQALPGHDGARTLVDGVRPDGGRADGSLVADDVDAFRLTYEMGMLVPDERPRGSSSWMVTEYPGCESALVTLTLPASS